MQVLAGLSAGVAVGAQLLVLRTVRRMARTRSEAAVVLSSEVAQLNVEWNSVLSNVFVVAARDTIALCPACHLGTEGTCVCHERRQALALAVGAAEEFVAAHASDAGSPRSEVAE